MSTAGDMTSLISWTLAFMRPYRGRMLFVAVLLLFEVVLGALEPWLLKVVIDYVLVGRPMPQPFAGWLQSISGNEPLFLLVMLVVAGVVLQILHQMLSAWSTQIQVDTGQRLVYSMRYRLLQHLQTLGLTHHVKTNTGDAV
jgi:ATP-binding cassette subfamily B protein